MKLEAKIDKVLAKLLGDGDEALASSPLDA